VETVCLDRPSVVCTSSLLLGQVVPEVFLLFVDDAVGHPLFRGLIPSHTFKGTGAAIGFGVHTLHRSTYFPVVPAAIKIVVGEAFEVLTFSWMKD